MSDRVNNIVEDAAIRDKLAASEQLTISVEDAAKRSASCPTCGATWEIGHQFTIGVHSERCAVCGGTGHVAAGFYDKVTDVWSMSTINIPETCRSCAGRGFIVLRGG